MCHNRSYLVGSARDRFEVFSLRRKDLYEPLGHLPSHQFKACRPNIARSYYFPAQTRVPVLQTIGIRLKFEHSNESDMFLLCEQTKGLNDEHPKGVGATVDLLKMRRHPIWIPCTPKNQ